MKLMGTKITMMTTQRVSTLLDHSVSRHKPVVRTPKNSGAHGVETMSP
jgi:hypothetical protein